MNTVLEIVSAPLRAGEVAGPMRDLEATLPAGDGVRWFCTIHRIIAESVEAAAVADVFEQPDDLAELEALLVGKFFDEVAAGERKIGDVRPSWRPLFEDRDVRDVHPLRFAVAGINAHVNTDLPLAIVATSQLGIHVGRDSALFRDFGKVNDVAETQRESIEDRFFDEVLQTLNEVVGSVDDLLEAWSFRTAREAAWVNGEVMIRLPGLAAVHSRILDRGVGFTNRLLLRS